MEETLVCKLRNLNANLEPFCFSGCQTSLSLRHIMSQVFEFAQEVTSSSISIPNIKALAKIAFEINC